MGTICLPLDHNTAGAMERFLSEINYTCGTEEPLFMELINESILDYIINESLPLAV